MELKVREIFYSLQGEGGRSGEPSIFIRLADCNLNCWFCFHENTKITTINGVKKIKDIKTEDIILTLDEKENIVKTNVDNVIVNEVDINDILKLSFDKTDIITTKNHPFYVKNKGWVNAEDLKLNDIIISLSKNQVNSFYMKENNPMYNEYLLKKRINTWKSKYYEGEFNLYWDKDRRKKQSTKMFNNNPMKDNETVKKNAKKHFRSKSKLEKWYDNYFKINKYNITYIGNNKLCIGDKENGYRFPDFIVDDTNKLIEIYDTTFPFYNNVGFRTKENYEQERKDFYKKFGYDVLFLTELSKKDDIRNILFNYIYNGQKLNKITEVKDISTKSYVRLFGNKDIKNIKMYNLSCSPYSSYIANNLLVHNCDTDWSWGNMMSIEEIKEEIKNYKGKWIVWTGGEPTLQLNNDILKEFSEYKHAIETNGTNPVPTLIDYITCSPKVEVGLDKLRENFPDGVQEFRFPYDRTRKLPKISELPKSDNYYISPLFLGEKKKRFLLDERNVKDAIDYVKENPEWKFSLQIHKIINIR
ncbi:MAG: hypothetical protein KC589_04400 [Nanoarchaeota archaeon]|nr:hypothetical protein [Nanoarchaeota archaeon]